MYIAAQRLDGSRPEAEHGMVWVLVERYLDIKIIVEWLVLALSNSLVTGLSASHVCPHAYRRWQPRHVGLPFWLKDSRVHGT